MLFGDVGTDRDGAGNPDRLEGGIGNDVLRGQGGNCGVLDDRDHGEEVDRVPGNASLPDADPTPH